MKKYCDKEINIEISVSNGWHETCIVHCGWYNGKGKEKYQCSECEKTK